MANQKINKRVVDTAKAVSGRDEFIWDTQLKGFGLRVTPKGAKSYVLQYRFDGGAARRMTIGVHGSPWTAELAREEAERVLLEIKRGHDPVVEKREAKRQAEVLAFDAYADNFVKLYLKEHWRDTWKSGQSVLNNVKPAFANKSIAAVTRRDVADLMDGYADRPGARKLTHSVLRKMFNWAVDRGDIEHSPVAGMKAPKAVAARKRVLTHEELVCAWIAAGELSDVFRPIVRLLILTLQRRDEVASLDWSELDIDQMLWVLPGERAKNDEEHRIPLSALAIGELKRLDPKKRGLVFTTTGITAASGFSKAKRSLDARMLELMRERAEKRGEDPETVKLAPWRYHDLRRTGATNLQALGVPVEVTEAVLNHISGTRGGVAGVYNRYRYDPEKRRALDLWAQHLSRMLANKGDVAREALQREAVIPLAIDVHQFERLLEPPPDLHRDARGARRHGHIGVRDGDEAIARREIDMLAETAFDPIPAMKLDGERSLRRVRLAELTGDALETDVVWAGGQH